MEFWAKAIRLPLRCLPPVKISRHRLKRMYAASRANQFGARSV